MSPLRWVAFTSGFGLGITETARYTNSMTNTLALWFGGILLAVFAVDYFFFDWELLIAFMRKFVEFIDFVAFWR